MPHIVLKFRKKMPRKNNACLWPILSLHSATRKGCVKPSTRLRGKGRHTALTDRNSKAQMPPPPMSGSEKVGGYPKPHPPKRWTVSFQHPMPKILGSFCPKVLKMACWPFFWQILLKIFWRFAGKIWTYLQKGVLWLGGGGRLDTGGNLWWNVNAEHFCTPRT